MRKKKDTQLNVRVSGHGRQQNITVCVLVGLLVCVALLSNSLLFHNGQTRSASTPRLSNAAAPGDRYLYYVLKQSTGFVLARARTGANNAPLGTPRVVASFSDDFGETTADNIISLSASPDGRFLAIDGTRSDGELVWVFDTQRIALNLEPASVSGTFLHWLPGASGMFLYRPMFPRGPEAPLIGGNWNPGLWEVNALTGAFTNIDISAPSASLVDAVPSPDGSQIIYSTSSGLGMGSDIWTMDIHGQHQAHLLQLTSDAQDIAGLFSWSPGGQSIAYERLSDGPTPFLPAGVWLMNRQGGGQRFLASADGGHGFNLSWSPDGSKVAFVARTNPTEGMADQSIQSLKSAIEVVDINSARVWKVASPMQTGMQINASPSWSADSSQIMFTAFNPFNPELGGTVHYWSVSTHPLKATPSVTQFPQVVTHVVGLS
jgi:hypothetical protein